MSRLAWTQRFGGAALEQAIFAGSNFLINIYLARQLPVDSYGAFVASYAWFLLTQNLFDAFVNEPMAILGAGKWTQWLDEYLGFLFSHHPWVGAAAAGLMGLVTVGVSVVGTPLETGAMVAATVATPFLLTRWLTRQPFFITGRPTLAAVGGLIYLVISLATMALLDHWSALSAVSALAAMAAGSVIAAMIVTVAFLEVKWRGAQELSRQAVVAEHWSYGRWAGVNKLLAWVPVNIFYVMLPTVASLADVGALRAGSNLTLPAYMLVTAMVSVLLPIFARSYNADGPRQMDRKVTKAFLGFFALTSFLGLLVVLFGGQLMHLLYRGQFDAYSSYAFYTALALQPVLGAPVTVYDSALRVLGGVKWSFVSSIIPSVLTPVLGLLLFRKFGLIGVVAASLVPQLILAVLTVVFYRRQLKAALTADAAVGS